MSILKALIQQGIACKEISRALRHQETISLLSCKWHSSMIIRNIKIFSQNVYKNKLLTNTILEVHRNFDIIFIQELPWFFICSIPSSVNEKGKQLVGALNHPNWITFSRNTLNDNDSSRVISYINIRLSQICFFLWKDIFNHRDISYFSFFNNDSIYFLINVYSDSSQTALKYLKNTEANINNTLIMAEDFNIRNNSWNLSLPYHFSYCSLLTNIVDSINLYISKSTNQVSTSFWTIQIIPTQLSISCLFI